MRSGRLARSGDTSAALRPRRIGRREPDNVFGSPGRRHYSPANRRGEIAAALNDLLDAADGDLRAQPEQPGQIDCTLLPGIIAQLIGGNAVLGRMLLTTWPSANPGTRGDSGDGGGGVMSDEWTRRRGRFFFWRISVARRRQPHRRRNKAIGNGIDSSDCYWPITFPIRRSLSRSKRICRHGLSGSTWWSPRRRPGVMTRPLPDGLDDFTDHNLITFKSFQESLDDWALKELTGHYVNYRKQVGPKAGLLPESDFRLYAVCAASHGNC